MPIRRSDLLRIQEAAFLGFTSKKVNPFFASIMPDEYFAYFQQKMAELRIYRKFEYSEEYAEVKNKPYIVWSTDRLLGNLYLRERGATGPATKLNLPESDREKIAWPDLNDPKATEKLTEGFRSVVLPNLKRLLPTSSVTDMGDRDLYEGDRSKIDAHIDKAFKDLVMNLQDSLTFRLVRPVVSLVEITKEQLKQDIDNKFKVK